MLRELRLSIAMSASSTSPLRGSTWDGPIAPKKGCALDIQRTEARFTSSVSKSASSGCTWTAMAFLKPMRSKALFQSRMPRVIASRYCSGIVLSSQ